MNDLRDFSDGIVPNFPDLNEQIRAGPTETPEIRCQFSPIENPTMRSQIGFNYTPATRRQFADLAVSTQIEYDEQLRREQTLGLERHVARPSAVSQSRRYIRSMAVDYISNPRNNVRAGSTSSTDAEYAPVAQESYSTSADGLASDHNTTPESDMIQRSVGTFGIYTTSEHVTTPGHVMTPRGFTASGTFATAEHSVTPEVTTTPQEAITPEPLRAPWGLSTFETFTTPEEATTHEPVTTPEHLTSPENYPSLEYVCDAITTALRHSLLHYLCGCRDALFSNVAPHDRDNFRDLFDGYLDSLVDVMQRYANDLERVRSFEELPPPGDIFSIFYLDILNVHHRYLNYLDVALTRERDSDLEYASEHQEASDPEDTSENQNASVYQDAPAHQDVSYHEDISPHGNAAAFEMADTILGHVSSYTDLLHSVANTLPDNFSESERDAVQEKCDFIDDNISYLEDVLHRLQLAIGDEHPTDDDAAAPSEPAVTDSVSTDEDVWVEPVFAQDQSDEGETEDLYTDADELGFEVVEFEGSGSDSDYELV